MLLTAGASGGASSAGLLNRWVPNGDVGDVAVLDDIVYLGGEFSEIGPRTGHLAAISAHTGAVAAVAAEVTGGPVYALVSDAHGGWFIGGDFTLVGEVPCPYLAHVRADGRLDRAWCPQPDGRVLALARRGATLYVGGFFDRIRGRPRRRLAAVDVATGRVRTWAPRVRGPDCSGADLGVFALAATGARIYVGGCFAAIGTSPRNSIAALDARTGRAMAWKPAEVGENVIVGTIVVAGQRVYLGGRFAVLGGASRRNLAALDARSGRALGWDPHPAGDVNALARAGSTMYVAGSFTRIAGVPRPYLAALDARSGRARRWVARLDGSVYSLAVRGRTVVAGGAFQKVAGARRPFLAALDARSGRPTPPRSHVNGPVWAIATAGERFVLGGSFTSVGAAVARSCLAAADVRTGALTGWRPNVRCPNGVDGVAAAGDIVYAAGSKIATSVGPAARGIVALDRATGAPRDWRAEFDADDWCLVDCALSVSNGVLYVAGDFGAVGGQERSGLAALDAVSGAVTPWDPRPNSDVKALAAAGSVVYVGGIFSRVGRAGRRRLAALDADTGLATSWDPGAGASVETIAVAGSTVFIGGDFRTVGGQPRDRIAAIDAATGSVLPWNPGANDTVNQIVVRGDTVYVAGDFDRIGGASRAGLAAIDSVSGALTPWDPALGARSVSRLAAWESGLAAAGFFDARIALLPLPR